MYTKQTKRGLRSLMHTTITKEKGETNQYDTLAMQTRNAETAYLPRKKKVQNPQTAKGWVG